MEEGTRRKARGEPGQEEEEGHRRNQAVGVGRHHEEEDAPHPQEEGGTGARHPQGEEAGALRGEEGEAARGREDRTEAAAAAGRVASDCQGSREACGGPHLRGEGVCDRRDPIHDRPRARGRARG